jgi:hypothetical protein
VSYVGHSIYNNNNEVELTSKPTLVATDTRKAARAKQAIDKDPA